MTFFCNSIPLQDPLIQNFWVVSKLMDTVSTLCDSPATFADPYIELQYILVQSAPPLLGRWLASQAASQAALGAAAAKELSVSDKTCPKF